MKLVLCQPAITRFKWELEVCLTNLNQVGFDLSTVILLFTQHDRKIPTYLADKYGVEVHTYKDRRDDQSYIPSVKPWLWWQFLVENPQRQQDTYFYFDSDVIFRQKPDFRRLKASPDRWLCSNTNNYLNLDYLRNCHNGDELLTNMARIIGVSVPSLETINNNSGGAQWVIAKPTAAYWHKVYQDCNRLYSYLAKSGSNVQIWTAEMWSQLWNMLYFNIGPQITPELDFCWATDPLKRWQETKILHNAGVTKKHKDLFFKGDYIHETPFQADLDFVNSQRCSSKYVDAIKQVKQERII